MIIGERLEALMRERGLSQAELARRIGVSQPTIFKALRNNKKGSVHVHQMARELQTTPEYLTGVWDDPAPAAAFLGPRSNRTKPVDDIGQHDNDGGRELTKEELALLDLIQMLEAGDRRALIKIAKSMAKRPATNQTLHSPVRA